MAYSKKAGSKKLRTANKEEGPATRSFRLFGAAPQPSHEAPPADRIAATLRMMGNAIRSRPATPVR